MPPTATNWAGNHAYRAAEILEPASVQELQDLVASRPRVRALGSRHTFTDLADSDGALVSLRGMPSAVDIDAEARWVRVGGGALYGVVAEGLHAAGWALATMASLPHISVAGAVATGTHGSGDRNPTLSGAVRAMEVVGPDGEIRRVARGDEAFDGWVVGLGALGIVVRLDLDIEPTYDVRQDVFLDLPWAAAEEHFDEITAAAYSVSLFTDWVGATVRQAWLKSRSDTAPESLFGARRARSSMHMLPDAPVESVSAQGGVSGPWHERLPHFRMGFTPSRGEELQSEYLLPRAVALDAFTVLRGLGPMMAPVLQMCEIRTVAADSLWLSGAYEQDTVAFHFTWMRDPDAVNALLPRVEKALLPLGARPHWGKCFGVGPADLAVVYPRLGDFHRLRRRVDPGAKFSNDFVDRITGCDDTA